MDSEISGTRLADDVHQAWQALGSQGQLSRTPLFMNESPPPKKLQNGSDVRNDVASPRGSSGEMPTRTTPASFSYPSPDFSEGDEGFDVGELFGALYRRKGLVVACAIFGVGAGYLAAGLQAPTYTVEALVQVGERDQRSVGVTAIEAGGRLSPISWANLVRSNRVLERVVEDLNLFVSAVSPTPADAFLDAEIVGPIRAGRYRLKVSNTGETVRLLDREDRVLETHDMSAIESSARSGGQLGTRAGPHLGETLGVRLNVLPESLPPGASLPFNLQPRRDAARGLAQGLRVETGMSAFMSVRISGTNPEWSARIVNSVVDSFLQEATELARAQSEELSGTLDEQLRSARADLEEAEAALEAFEATMISRPDLAARGLGAGGAEAELLELRAELDHLRRDRGRIEAVLCRSDDEGTLGVQALESIPTVRESSELLVALEEVTEKRAEIRSLLLRYTDEHPMVRDLRGDLDQLEGTAIPAIAREHIGELDARIADLEQRASGRSAELQQVPAQALNLTRLRREVEQAETLYNDVSRRYSGARLAAISTTPDLQVVDRAEPPARPDADRSLLFAAMAFFGFAGAGGLGAILLDRRDPTVRSPKLVETEMGLPVLGTAPHLRFRRGKVDPRDQRQAIEAFRSIRLALLYAYGSSGPLVSTISSPAPGDGKSFITSNLGLSFAELGRRTVIVDGDVRKGVQHTLFSLKSPAGLTDYLRGKESIDSVVQATDHPSLSVIRAGPPLRNAPESMTTGRMQDLLASLKEEFDVILVDSPPFGAASDPLILGALAGNLVMVLRNAVTDTGQAEAALKQLRRYPIRMLGAIVNDAPSSGEYRYYHYHEGYDLEGERSSGPARGRLVGSGT